MSRRGEGGQAALELVVLAVPVFLLLFLVVYAARLPQAQARVDEAAQAAARAASITGTVGAARRAATAAAQASLADLGVTCRQLHVDVDVTGFRRGGTVAVTVACAVDQSDLSLLRLPGTRTVSGRFVSSLDVAGAAP